MRAVSCAPNAFKCMVSGCALSYEIDRYALQRIVPVDGHCTYYAIFLSESRRRRLTRGGYSGDITDIDRTEAQEC